MQPEVQCITCHNCQDESVDDEAKFWCHEKSVEMNGMYAKATRTCKFYRVKEEDEGSREQLDYIAAVEKPTVPEITEKIMEKMEQKRAGRKPKITEKDIEVMIAMYEAGDSIGDIGVHLGVNKSTVHEKLHDAGVKMRKPGGNKKKGRKARAGGKYIPGKPETLPEPFKKMAKEKALADHNIGYHENSNLINLLEVLKKMTLLDLKRFCDNTKSDPSVLEALLEDMLKVDWTKAS